MKTAQNISLEIKRFINAPRSRVYSAWTDPVELRKWFGPEKVRTNKLVTDARVGGKFHWDLTTPEGEELTMLGEYRELQHDRKVVFTWQWQNDDDWTEHVSVVTVELFDRDGGTELRLKHENLPNEASRDGHNGGWNSALDKLERFLTK